MIPLLVLGAVGIYGVYKSAAGVMDSQEAEKTNTSAKDMVFSAHKQGTQARKQTNELFEDYGSRKMRAFNCCIADFLDSFGRLKNVQFEKTPELDQLQLGDLSSTVLRELRSDHDLLTSSGMGLGSGLTGGAAVAFGAYNGTMLLATASTGTAISTLGGAAATNATLAWLGGGTIVAGGGGVAMGAMVLGGLIAAPALLIAGYFIGTAGSDALANAGSNLEKAKSLQDESKQLCEQLQAIQKVTGIANTAFSKLSTQLRRSVDVLDKVMTEQGEDYQTYSEEGKLAVFRAVKFAQLIKAMIDTPILDEEGRMVLSTEKRVSDISQVADGMKASTS